MKANAATKACEHMRNEFCKQIPNLNITFRDLGCGRLEFTATYWKRNPNSRFPQTCKLSRVGRWFLEQELRKLGTIQ